ncbi:hypothetical protein [Pedobacter sp. L105]|uniref:hypothetical protein n=1 Tax=Pedobacter sp. L105 TaxID=1641871 RepID=UPI00131A73BB|nr:hypothetical protein [Pedobacter sp. L105]
MQKINAIIKNVIYISLCLLLSSCGSQKSIFEKGETYSNFRGFEPTDPTEYDNKVQIVSNEQSINKEIRYLSTNEILSFLNNETVLVSIGQLTVSGDFSYLPITVSSKHTSYKVTMDYMKFATIGVRDTLSGNFIGFKRIGVGLRLISLISTKEAGINLGDLSSIGLAAKAGKLTGTLMIEVIGIKSKEITTLLPMPSEINQTTIQNAMQALATIKSKIYDSDTKLYPQIMAVKTELLFPASNKKDNIQKEKIDSVLNENKLKIQFGNSKFDHAKTLERQGFNSIYDKNIDQALQYFGECEKTYPSYHNVYEIAQLLKKERLQLTDKNSVKWVELYGAILKDYSWGLSPEIIENLKQGKSQ